MRPNDLPLLVSLDTLLELRNVTHAARKLHVTQPALSAQLARLRTLFNDPLLVPSESGRGMVATPKALQIAQPLREALRQIEAVGRNPDAFDPACDAVAFRIMGDAASLGTLGGRLASAILQEGNPGMHVRLLSMTDDVLDSFERDAADILIAPLAAVPQALRSRTLFSERHVAVHRKGSGGIAGPLGVEQYCAAEHVAVEGDDRLEARIAASLGHDDAARRIAVTVARHDLLPAILEQTDLMATVPASLVRHLGEGLEVHELPFLDADTIVMAWHKRHDGDERQTWLRQRVLAFADRTADPRSAPPAPLAQPTTVAMLPRRPLPPRLRQRA